MNVLTLHSTYEWIVANILTKREDSTRKKMSFCLDIFSIANRTSLCKKENERGCHQNHVNGL